jgi:hypothetical protein
MLTKNKKLKVYGTVVGAWLMMLTTIAGMFGFMKTVVTVTTGTGAAYILSEGGLSEHMWSRNDSENESVHMPTKFDVGLRTPGIAGRR